MALHTLQLKESSRKTHFNAKCAKDAKKHQVIDRVQYDSAVAFGRLYAKMTDS
jgi:hypothetical protein